MKIIGTIWENLTRPSAFVTNPLAARRLRVMAAGCLVVLCLGLPATTAQLVLAPEDFMGDPWLVFAAYGGIGLLYLGARSRAGRLATWAFVVAGTAGMWLMLGSSTSAEELLVGAPLALLPYVFAALLHRRLALWVVGGLSLLGLGYVAYTVPGLTPDLLIKFTVTLSLVSAAIAGLQSLARRDHSDLRQRTLELEQAWGAARSAEAARARFLATVHHELRTPLNGILGASMLLAETETSDEQRELIQAVHDSGTRLHGLVEDVLTYVSEGVGELSFENSPTRVGSVLDDVVARHRPLASARSTTITHVDSRPPQLLLDEGRLRHVITHLVRNAVMFTEDGHIQVTSDWDGKQLTVTVEDTGAGMSEHQLAHAFAPLQQGDDSSTRPHEGLGLGLSTSRALAQAMGGSLSASSAPGAGSRFVLMLPGRELRSTAA